MKLHHSLAESLDTDQGIIAQFFAPEPDAAIEAVVYDLAYISAAWLGKRVLFVNGTSMKVDTRPAGAGVPCGSPIPSTWTQILPAWSVWISTR